MTYPAKRLSLATVYDGDDGCVVERLTEPPVAVVALVALQCVVHPLS